MEIETFEIERPDGALIHAESVGSAGDPAILLIGGATWSLDWWEDGFCERLVDRGLRVLRYDNRDSGASTSYPKGEPGYDADDVIADAIAVLDAAGAERAIVAGLSMGGGLAQRLGLSHRDRVAALALLSTAPIESVRGDLPGPDPALFADEPPEPDWSDREAAITRIVEDERPYAGPGNFDEERIRAIAARVYDRTRDIAANRVNHFAISSPDAEPRLADLEGLPTLVIHGDADPLLPLEHGRALADAIPGARLLVLEGVGHQAPPPTAWDRVADELAALASRD